jgi:sodium-dependent dicarboxylate transporter 2/3/5
VEVRTNSSKPGESAYGLRHRLGLLAGPVLFVLLLLVPPPAELGPAGTRIAALATLMSVWWITEAIPIPATALFPLALIPLLGAGTIREAAAPYANPLIFLFMGGFMMALAMQRWGLHRRMALHIIQRVGSRPAPLVAGFMVSSALLSMWVSNTATAMMMLPIGVSVIDLAREEGAPHDRGDPFAVALLLGIAYACSIGGVGTLIGTPPNAFMAAFLSETYGREVGFAQWMLLGVPLLLISLPLTFWMLTRVLFPLHRRRLAGERELLSDALAAMGPMTRAEKMVTVVFVLTAGAWIFRPLLGRWIGGLSDPGIAVTAAIVLFLLPLDLRRGVFLLDWSWAQRVPWGVLLLFGGGLSLAAAIQRTGLAAWTAQALQGLSAWPLLLVVLAAVALIIFLTELTSNTATAAVFLPILASVAKGMGYDPLVLVVPAAVAASCAFMLPVATPPNAIIYGSDRLTIPQMARAGLFLNLLFIVLITGVTYLLVPVVFGLEMG